MKALLLLATLLLATPCRATDFFVNGEFCGVLAPLYWKRRAIAALDCHTLPGDPIEATGSASKLFLRDHFIGHVCDIAPKDGFGGMDCTPKYAKPLPGGALP